MKKVIVLFLLTISVTSCVVKESLVFNADKSGKLKYTFDLNKLAQMGGGKSKGKKGKEVVDSTFTFKDLYKDKQDSIAKLPFEEQHKLRQMEKFNLHLVMNEEKGVFLYEMYTNFQSPSELEELFSPINAASSLNPAGTNANLSSKDTPKNDGVTQYTFDGKKFTKFVKVQPKDELNQEIKNRLKSEGASEEEINETNELSQQMTETFEKLYQESSYETTITFPQKIKKVNVKNAVISKDGKSVTIPYSMEDYMKSTNLNFEVELE
jgi:hypothetical protein